MAITFSIILVYFGFYLFIVFLSLSIACGLYYLAELIEEYTVTTKRVLGYVIKAELVLHLLLFVDRLPFYCIALGFIAHVMYIRCLRSFPFIQLTSDEGIAAIAAFLANTAAWTYHFWKGFFTIEYILAFMLVTTLSTPFIFFLSMSGEQAVLPGAGGFPYSSPSRSPSSGGFSSGVSGGVGGDTRQKQRRSLALRIFDVLKRKRDQVLPDVVSRFPASSGLMPKEKI